MSKILLFIFDNMTDFEITFATHLLSTEADKEIVTIAYENRTYKGKSGISYIPDKIIDNLLLEDVEGLILPGGWFSDDKPELINLIQNMNKSGKLLAGICGAGTVLLAKSGALNNVKYTSPITYWSEHHKKVFGEIDPFPRDNFILERVVRDKNIITAQGISFIDFAIEICDWFNLFQNKNDKEKFASTFRGRY